MGNCAGVDWASGKHDVLVADAAGEPLLAATYDHTEAGIGALCRELVRLRVERVAVERPDGLLVERMLDAGLHVLGLHPIRSRPPGRGFAPPAASRTVLTRSCSASSPGPTITASACSRPTVMRPRRCAP